jgi:multiple sugar transport system ATP-binding protein
MAELRTEELWKRFGKTEVLKGINLEIGDGEFVVLVGPSGCGKSTLLNLIAGLETVSEGRIFIGDRLVNDIPPKDRDIAMVFQSYALYPTKTVRENITFGLVSRGVPKEEQARAVEEVSTLLHIEAFLDRKPAALSGGQRQRVAMGRALVRHPDVFLFDEPLSNLDAKLRIEMRTEIKKLHQRLGKTVVYVTHDQVEAMTLASRIAVMDNGHIRQFDTPDEVYENPVDLFVASFMGSPPMNIMDGRVMNDEGLKIEVTDGEGTIHFPVPEQSRAAVEAYLGKNVKLGLRPETITRAGVAEQTPELFRFERCIDLVEPTGPDVMLVFTLGGPAAVARVRPQDRAEMDALYQFEVDMAKAKIFDAETGKRI